MPFLLLFEHHFAQEMSKHNYDYLPWKAHLFHYKHIRVGFLSSYYSLFSSSSVCNEKRRKKLEIMNHLASHGSQPYPIMHIPTTATTTNSTMPNNDDDFAKAINEIKWFLLFSLLVWCCCCCCCLLTYLLWEILSCLISLQMRGT